MKTAQNLMLHAQLQLQQEAEAVAVVVEEVVEAAVFTIGSAVIGVRAPQMASKLEHAQIKEWITAWN